MSNALSLIAALTAFSLAAAAPPPAAGAPSFGESPQLAAGSGERAFLSPDRFDALTESDRSEVRYSVWSVQLSGLRFDALCRGRVSSVSRREGERELSRLDVGGGVRLRADLTSGGRPVGGLEVSFQPVHAPRQRDLISDTLTEARVAVHFRW